MRELDLMLIDFVDHQYPQLDSAQRSYFEQLLQNEDQLLLAWLMGHQPPTDPAMAALVERIRRAPKAAQNQL